MKKVISLLLTCIFLFSFCGCSNANSSEYSEWAVEAAENTIYYSEQYINGAISAAEAKKHIESVYDDFEVYLISHKNSDTYFADSSLQTKILGISISFTSESFGGGEISDIKNEVEELKEEIGY